MLLEKPEGRKHSRPVSVVESDDTADRQHLVDEEEVEQGVLVRMQSVDVRHIDLGALLEKARQREVVEVLDQLMAVSETRPLDVEAADPVPLRGLERVDGDHATA